MPLDLVTGVPGSGKTLYTVSELLAVLVGQTITLDDGRTVKRRLMIGGIRDLLIEHERIDVPIFDPEREPDQWGDKERKPGEPPLPVPRSAANWWLWCEPGDVIVIDECQRLFRPMASGRKAPGFIRHLETHRHYGVDFIIITQHPQLIHANVRALIGSHRHVRRVFGSHTTFVYQWDCCTNPDRIKNATKQVWRHNKKAYSLYKSAEVHTKQKFRIPFAVFAFIGGLAVLAVMGWTLRERLGQRFSGAPAPASVSSGSSSSGKSKAAPQPQAAPVVLEATAGDPQREPYAGLGVHLDGGYSGPGGSMWSFGLSIDGRRVATVTSLHLARAGYTWEPLAPCVGRLSWRALSRVVTCNTPHLAPTQTQREAKADPAAQG